MRMVLLLAWLLQFPGFVCLKRSARSAELSFAIAIRVPPTSASHLGRASLGFVE